jgi:hypothetical protein
MERSALEKRVDATFSEVAESLGPILRNIARDSGWPEAVAKSLRVRNHEGELTAEVPPHLEQTAESLEYGDIGEAPKPALHTFYTSRDVDDERSRKTDEAMTWALDEIGGMFR